MKKRNVATAMAAAMAFGGVAPVVANANEPQGRAIVEGTGKFIDVALAHGKKVTPSAKYTDVYNTNFTDETKDDAVKTGKEILFMDGEIKAITSGTNATFLIAEKMTKAELDETAKNPTTGVATVADEVKAAKKDLDDTVDQINRLLSLTVKDKDGKEVKIYKLTKEETVKSATETNLRVKLEVTEEAKKAGIDTKVYENQEYNFKNVALEQDAPVIDNRFGDKEVVVTTTSGVQTLNKYVYELKNASGITIEQNEANDGNDLVLTVFAKDEKKTQLGTITLIGFKEFKKNNFKGFVDLAEMKDLAELDLPELSYAKDAIMDALVTGKLQGDERGFRPKDSITRAEFAKMLVELANVNVNKNANENFADVNKDDWFYGYVAGLADLGIVEGDERGFRPNDAITRQEAAVMIAAMKNITAGKASKLDKFNSVTGKAIDSVTTFKDDKSIELWADAAVKYLQETGISRGDENKNFNPANNITRAESVVMITKAADARNVVADDIEK